MSSEIRTLRDNLVDVLPRTVAKAVNTEDGRVVENILKDLEESKGQPNGIATLGPDGKVLDEQLPPMDFISISDKGVPGGVATLGSDGNLLDSQVPDSEKIEYNNGIHLPGVKNVKEALDLVSGKLEIIKEYIGVKIVIGTTQSGHTSSDCDFLCTGINDEVQFNAAIESVEDSVEIIVLPGTYNIYSSINVNGKTVSIIGSGSDNTILKRAAEPSSSFAAVIDGLDCNLYISKVTVDGGEEWVGLVQKNNGLVRRRTVTTVERKNFVAISCVFKNGDSLVSLSGSINDRNAYTPEVIESCKFLNFSAKGVSIEQSSLIKDCHFYSEVNYTYKFAVSGRVTGYPNRFIFLNNIITGDVTPLSIGSISEGIVTDNHMACYNSYGSSEEAKISSFSVEGTLIIANNELNGIRLWRNSSFTQPTGEVVFIGNHVIGSYLTAEKIKNSIIASNHFMGYDTAIVLENYCDGISIEGNTISCSGFDDSSYYPIQIKSGNKNCLVSNNLMRSPRTYSDAGTGNTWYNNKLVTEEV